MNVTDFQEVWQIDVGGQIYEANFEIVTQWIFEGSLLPQDLVKRGNLRWIEAKKVPALLNFFNAKAQGMPPPVFASTTNGQSSIENQTTQTQNFAPPPFNQYQTTTNQLPENNFQESPNPFDVPHPNQNFNSPDNWQDPSFAPQPQNHNQSPTLDFCSMHPDAPSVFICETCANGFCPACPKSYGGTVKICPFCGAMCKPVAELKQKTQEAFQYEKDLSKGFGFEDFFNALAYPFKFKTSLFFGAIMFMFFTLGQGAASMGSIFMVAAALFCWMMANTLTFGVLANTVENFSQGKVGGNFMPSFDDFSLWDDVVHPFFLCLAVYIVSFGLFVAIIVGGIWYTFKSATSLIPNEAAQTKILTDKDSPFRKNPSIQKQKDLYGDGEMPDESRVVKSQSNSSYDEEKEFKRLNDMINEQRKKQLESGLGKMPETQQQQMQEMIQNFLKMAIPFLFVLFLAFLWGIFYLPAACCVAGYTRSFVATLNPTIGLETIKILGWDYVKLWLMGFLIVVASVIIGFVLGAIFIAFDMPTFGNLPVKAIGALFAFYFSVVFSVAMGFALYKNTDKLNLFKG
ncbi:MAG: hypothetical protein ABJA66_16425 [Actinomycetota bacterium]